jgi:hypothetical protein
MRFPTGLHYQQEFNRTSRLATQDHSWKVDFRQLPAGIAREIDHVPLELPTTFTKLLFLYRLELHMRRHSFVDGSPAFLGVDHCAAVFCFKSRRGAAASCRIYNGLALIGVSKAAPHWNKRLLILMAAFRNVYWLETRRSH